MLFRSLLREHNKEASIVTTDWKDIDGAKIDEGEGEVVDLEGDDLGRHGCADVRPHDDADGLLQGHQPGVDEADGHHGRSAAALDEDRDENPHEDAAERRLRQRPDQVAHTVPRYELQGLAHQLDSVEKKAYAAGCVKQYG